MRYYIDDKFIHKMTSTLVHESMAIAMRNKDKMDKEFHEKVELFVSRVVEMTKDQLIKVEEDEG